MADKLYGVCGLDCRQCPGYIALKTNDNFLREKTAKEWSEKFGHDFKPSDINCVGCTIADSEGTHCGYCQICAVRNCALEKKIANCNACSDFADCKSRQDFEKQSGLNIRQNFLNK
jgi:hypothetical protein